MASSHKRDALLVVAIIVTAAAVLCVDLMIELGVAGGVPYVAAVCLAYWVKDRRWIWIVAGGCCVLTVIGYHFSPPGGEVWKVVLNRALALFAIVVTATLCDVAKRAHEQLRKSEQDLQRRVEERTADLVQSALSLQHANEELRQTMEKLELANQTLEESNIELQQYMRELELANRDLQDFAQIVSHDLKEPLRAVSGFGNLLQQRYRRVLDDTGKEFVQHMVNGATRMNDLLHGLLTYSHVGTHGAAFEPADCNELLDIALENLHVAIQESNAHVERDRLPTLRCDRTQMVQLFQNLIANAIKYRGRRDIQIRINASELPGFWQFRVQDNGIGFESRHHERIFKVFQRLHRRESYSGIGLGLAICRRIVQRHGGRIWAESELDVGSTFFFTVSEAGAGDQE